MNDTLKQQEEETTTSTRTPRKHRKRNDTGLVRYLTLLFFAAFLMLLLAYFMQLRTSEATIGSLKESLSSFESLNDLVLENQSLHDELDDLQDARNAQDAENRALSAQNEALTQQNEQLEAYLALYQVLHTAEHLVENQDYDGAQHLLLDYGLSRLPEQLAQYDATYGADDSLTPCYKRIMDALEEHLPDD